MFPLIIGAYFANPFYVGLYRYGDSYVYVSPGTVYWGMPVRIFTQHEITKITLVREWSIMNRFLSVLFNFIVRRHFHKSKETFILTHLSLCLSFIAKTLN